MKIKRDYLEKAVKEEYKGYSKKGLALRARPFLNFEFPKKPKRFLVVGMALGGAEEVEALNKFFPKYKIYGIDIAKSALNQNLNATLVHCDLAKLKFKEKFFSGIMCAAVMHEVYSYSKNGNKKVKKAFSEISRTLSKGGIVAIREFFLPDEKEVRLIVKSKKALEFSKRFKQSFRKSFDQGLSEAYVIKKNSIFATKKLLYELMLHFRVAEDCFKTHDCFFKSKEIEESYLPFSITDYCQMAWKNGLEVRNIEYIDFPKYYKTIDSNFKLVDLSNKKIENKFGFIDVILQKK